MRLFYTLLVCLYSLICFAQEPETTVYFDFGPDDGTNGNVTVSPDANSIHWNNWTSPTSNVSTPLVDAEGNRVQFGLFMTNPMSTNGINHGGLLAPDPDLLGEFAVNTVTQDYFFTNDSGGFAITRMRAGKAYRLTFFGSRENTEERVTRYRVNNNITERSYELTTSGTDLGAEGYDGNNNTVVTTDLFFNTDAFRITVERAAGSFAYLSGMKLEEFAGNEVVNVTDLSLSGADITDNGGTTQLVATTIPADATFQEVTWTIDDPTVAALGADGHLTAITNGTVVATARPTEPGTSVRAQIKIEISNQESRSVFLDCGPDDGINGNATLSPDANGTHWNNAVSSIGGADSVFLLDATGAATGYALTIGKAMSTNGLRHGGLTDPVDSLLGDFAIGTATQDYFFTSNSGILTFSGLDPEKGYRFHLFASRATDDPRTTGYAVNGLNGASGDLASSNNDRRTFSTDLVRPLPDGTLNLEITNEVGQFGYLNALRMMEYAGFEICPDQDPLTITFMGSSVARGQGAPHDEGYAFQYTTQLAERFATMRSDNDWTVRNVSVGGDNTPRVLRRFGSDLVSACGSYVVFGLSLANEGIRNGDQRIFDQFRDNLRTLINNSRAVGLQPVVVSNYPRGDYDAQDYQFIKDMNLLIHQWDVPSVNVLGAVDDGAGRWAAGFQDDLGHPNLAGHQEFFHAFVPSLFDALAAGKPQPVQQRDPQGIRMFIPDQRLSFEPEDTLHSFSLAFTAAVRKVGELARFVTQDGSTASLAVNTLGQLTYSSTAGEITHSADLGDALPHHILLTHNYARGRTELFVDGKVADTGLAERVIATEFRVGVHPEGGQADFTVANLTFWRSSLNPDEAMVAATGEALLQGSLEIYAPLAPEDIGNLAQSTNALTYSFLVDVTDPANALTGFTAFPNPTNGSVTVRGAERIQHIDVFDVRGARLLRTEQANTVNLANLSGGVYFLRVRGTDGVGLLRVLVR